MSESARRPIRSGAVINIGLILAGLVGIGALLTVQLASGEEEAPLPAGTATIEFGPVAAGLDGLVLLVGDGAGGRLVVEQVGRIRRLAADGSVVPQPVLDISARVTAGGEQGLLGLALHPQFGDNGRLFVAYTRADDGALTISEFTAVAGAEVIDGASERTLLTIPQPYGNHNGGHVAFDTEGMLLVGVGDGGSAGDPLGSGQDRASLLGTLLRLDVDRGWPYATPPDNGFADDPEARPEIHAIGLRNPWRFSVDAADGAIYIGDVGQGRWEEVNVLPRGTRGADFGWAAMEGAECYEGACDPSRHTLPAVAYPHVADGVSHCSIIGGEVYRGAAGTLPLGTYLYADYCSGTIWAVPASELLAGRARPEIIARAPEGVGRVTSFGRDDAGELYLLTTGGRVLAIAAAGAPA